MNGYAALAFAMPVVALALGWAAVAWHRRSLRRPAAPAAGAVPVADLDGELAALKAQFDETAKGAARLRARLDEEAGARAARKAAGADDRAIAAG